MASNERLARKVDREKSMLWAISSRGSVGVGPVGTQLFHLVNRETHRGHLLEVNTLGVGLSLPVTGSVGSSDYENFKTATPKNFFDFDGTHTTIRETNALIYSWTTISFWGMSVKIADGGFNVPGLGVSHGKMNVIFGDGRPLGLVDLEIKLPPIQPEPEPFKKFAKEDALVYRIPSDLLFAFDKHHLIPGLRTENALTSVGYSMHSVPDYRYLIIGHTDSIGDDDYNLRLSKRRAETVAKWFKAHNFGRPDWTKTVGVGKSEPIASNATKDGRSQNRRVEVIVARTHIWNSYN